MRPQPFVLIVLDGWGINPSKRGNAIKLASTPNFDSYLRDYPHTQLKAFGDAVGLEPNTLGGSEVGHLHIGAGRIVEQALKAIDKSIRSGQFFKNKAFLTAIKHVKRKQSALHLIGLLSDGGVHSDYNHLFALLRLCKLHGLSNVFIHAFLDGRDVKPGSAPKYLKELESKCRSIGVGQLATLIGRVYSMDRANRWERTELAYRLLVLGKGRKASDPIRAIKQYFKKGYTDQFVPPTVIQYAPIKDRDAVICFNYRADRARQLISALTSKRFESFKREFIPKIKLVAMAPYSREIRVPAAFKHTRIKHTLGEVFSRYGFRQLRIAETEKYVHVTYFFNGDSDKRFRNEDRICIPSPKVKTYDQKPEMSASEVTGRLLKELPNYDFALINYANPDMLGHTGNLKAAIKGVEYVDGCLGKVIKEVKSLGGAAIITADHGNADEMLDKNGEILTSHSRFPVPFIVVSDEKIKLKQSGGLYNIAPTVLELLKIRKPKAMEASSLIE